MSSEPMPTPPPPPKPAEPTRLTSVNARHPGCTCSKGRLCATCLGISERRKDRIDMIALVVWMVFTATLIGVLLATLGPGPTP